MQSANNNTSKLVVNVLLILSGLFVPAVFSPVVSANHTNTHAHPTDQPAGQPGGVSTGQYRLPDISASTYPIYGGWNDYDTFAPGWTAGSDNVVWDFGNTDPVYRQLKSLSLRYNPKGEFHMTTSPFIVNPYKWLSFTGRSDDSDLDFSITFTDSTNNPIGTALKFSDHGGQPTDDYWTQYNFAIPDFGVATASVGGIRITQLSNEWGAELYLDEVYLSNERGENINPALPTPDPLRSPTPITKHKFYPPPTNPFVFIVPAVFAVIIVMFH